MASPQLSLPGFDSKKSSAFGGSKFENSNPKSARFVVTKEAMHLTLSSRLAPNDARMAGQSRAVEKLIVETGRKCFVEINNLAIHTNHIHMLIKAKSRRAYMKFIRAITGLIPRRLFDLQRGRSYLKSLKEIRSESLIAKLKEGSFWVGRPFTRIVFYGKDLKNMAVYFMKNRLELLGLKKADSKLMLAEIDRLKSLGLLRELPGI